MLKKLLIISCLAFVQIGYGQKIAAGSKNSFVICNDGRVKAFGSNSDGRSGVTSISKTESLVLPELIPNLNDIDTVAAGSSHTLFLKHDGTVLAVGYNGNGQLGLGDNTDRIVPTQIAGINNVKAIAAGGWFSLFLKNDGTVWAAGKNRHGSIGFGSIDQVFNTPVQITGLNNVVAIAAGTAQSFFIKNDGTVWATGLNVTGALGLGDLSNRNIPTQISGLTGVRAVATNYFNSYFLKNDGTVWACGSAVYGQLGNGTEDPSQFIADPVKVLGLHIHNIIGIASGRFHAVLLEDNGNVWGLGNNGNGQLGIGNYAHQNIPVQIQGLSNITYISAGEDHSLFVKNNSTVWACGYNGSGHLGNGTVNESTIPINIGDVCALPPSPPAVDFSNFPSSLCVGSNVSVNPSISGSNPERSTSIDNSIALNAPKSICRNSQAVFILQDNDEILRFGFDGTLQYTYNAGAALLSGINAITVDENNNVWADAGNLQSYFYRLTPAGTLDVTLDCIWASGNTNSMFFLPNGYATDDLFIMEDSLSYTSVDVDNTDPFSNGNSQASFSSQRFSSITYDNKVYPEKRLILADPKNSKLWSRQLTVTGVEDFKLLVDSANTANSALDFVYADTIHDFICTTSKAKNKKGIIFSYLQNDGTLVNYFDTLSQTSVPTQIPVGMISIPRGSMHELWIADRGQNKLVRVSILVYSISPALQDGLKFNTYSGRIEGTPVNPSSPQTYMVIVQNGLGIDTTYVTFGVNPASNITNNLGASSANGNQADGLTIKYYDPNNCSRLLEIADQIGGTSPGQTQITQTTYPLVGVIANDSLIRRVNTIRSENMDTLTVNIKLYYSFDDIKIFNQTRGSALLTNDTVGGSMQMAVLQMHDKPDGSKEPIIHSPVTATWSTANQHWAVTVPVTKFSDFYGSDMSTVNNFNCSNTGTVTLNLNTSYYVWNYDTLLTSGTYVDTLINHTGCDSIATLNLTLLTTGISSASVNKEIGVFPNPTNGLLNVVVKGQSIQVRRIRIMNVVGVEVYNNVLNGSTTVDMSSLGGGIYSVIIETNDKPVIYRIIKE